MMKKLLLLAALVVMLLAVSLIAACSDGGTTSEPVPKDPPVVAPDDPSPPVDPSEEDPFGEPSEGDPSGEDQDEDPDDEPVPPVEFTYTFLGADGSELFSDSVTEGDYIPDDVLVAPSVDHYTFVGWSVGGARVTFPYSPTEDTVFVALYEINVYDYAFVVNGEAELSGSAPALTELTISSAPSVECDHYEFEGWAVNGTVVELPYVLTGDVTFNAVFTPIEYKVIYHLGDMEGKVENDNPDTYTVADIEHVLSALEHPCYGECEWYLDKTFTGEPIEYIPKNGGDVHLYAKWSDPHHFYNEDHVCTVCEEQAEQKGHVFEDSHECTICSFIAANHDYVNGKCVMCGKPCLHEKYDESHHCAECDMPAETLGHEYDTSHKCTICGHEHETRHHVYDNDYLCTICRVAHADHDYGEDHFCEICGRPYGSAEHEYENGVCTVCGKSEVWDGSIADGFSAGSGTAEDPYIIASASELAYLAKLTNEGECSADMYFALGTDIRLGGRSWTPIGKGYTTTEREVVDSAFRGHFDGRGHTVYGLVVNADESAAQEDTEAGRAFACAGLFGAVMGGETNAEVKNLRVSGYEIKFTAAAKDISVNVGGLIGTAHKATVYCCAADGVIEIRTGGDVRAGGLLGGVEDDNRYGSVSACTSDCTITVYAGGVSHVGGMAGYAGFGRFTDCAAFSVIEVECAETVVAGFATGTNAKTVINECFAQTDITCSAGTTDVFAIGCKTGSSFFGDGLVNGIPVGSGCDGVSAGDIAEAVASFGSSGLVPTNGTALPYTFAENASVPDDHEHVYNASHECMVCGKPHEISEHSFIGSHECTVCGFIAVEHNYDPETGKCTMCGEECAHDYDSGVCTVCGYRHTDHRYNPAHICEICGIEHETPGHVYENGSCTICDHEHSPHEYEGSHTCKVCGYTDTSGHVFDSETGICTVCGDACKHEYENGVCTICDYEHTVHNYEGSHVCTVCGYTATDHDYDAATGKCTMCGEECTHDFAGSHVCTVCGYTVTAHDYDATTGKCIMCGEECVHDYDGGTCTVCGYKHTAHDYDTAHICKVCGIAYETPEHVYKNGVCTICGDKHSPHEYEGSHTCKVCGYTDTSGHAFDPETGICTVCGEVCKHEYENGVCTVCGATEKWDGTPAESFGGGSGTESDPYIISNAAELAYLAEFTAAGKAVYGTCFSLTADIDLCGNEWTPIGSGYYTESVYADRAFGGTFKGNGHTIRGLVITSAEFEYNGETGRDHASVGLFGAVCGKGTEYAVIQGLTVENAVITLSVSEKDSQTAVGILAGMASSVIMEDCVVSGSITVTTSGRADVGGLIGGIINSNRYGDINGCAADTVMELTAGDELYAGGLVGKASYGKMTGSSAECEINAEGTRMSVAGFAVNYGKYKTKAESCHSFAVITVPDGRNIKCDVFMPGGGDVDSCTYSALSAVNGEAAASSSGAVAV